MSTWALVENNDDTITYGGPWIRLSNPGFDFDLSGSSAHYLLPHIVNTMTPPATLAFNFTGREIGAYGVASIFNNSVQVPDPDMPVWECLVDGNVIPNTNPYGTYPLESYCEATSLNDDITHTFEMRVSQSGSGFWIDFFKYRVGGRHFSAVPPNTTAWIGPTDFRLEYGDGWAPIGDGFMTTRPGPPTKEVPALTFIFTGSSVTWYALSKAAIGIADPSLPALLVNITNGSPGFYTVDDASDSHDFSANIPEDVAHANTNPYSVPLFTTPQMETGVHTLNVYYDENSTAWPLTLDFLTVEDAFSIAPTFLSSPASAPSSSRKSKAAIIGGAVGGVIGGLLLVLLTLFIRRRFIMNRRERRRRDMLAGLERSDIKLQPFTRLADTDPGTALERSM